MNSLSVPKVNRQDKDRQLNMEAELQRLMNAYGNDVLRTSYMFMKDLHKAEDAYQEVFIRVFNKLESFRGDSSEKSWIISITMNVCKDLLRSAWLKRVMLSDKISSHGKSGNIENRLIRKDENRLLFNEVMALPAPFKEVIILYYYHELSTAEIGKILKVAEGTVRSRLHRAREILKSKLGGRIDWSE